LNCATTYNVQGVISTICGTYTGEGVVIHENNGDLEFDRIVQLHSNAVKGLSHDGGVICSVAACGEIAFHSAADLSLICRKSDAHEKIANDCAALPGTGFVSISRDRILRIWEPNGELISTIHTPHTHSIKCVAVSNNGRHIATGSYGGHVAIFDIELDCWAYYGRLTSSGISSLLNFSLDTFVAGSYDGRLYNVSV